MSSEKLDVETVITDFAAILKLELEPFKIPLPTSTSQKEYKEQEIDESIICNGSEDVILSLPEFEGSIFRYKGWRQMAQATMKVYKKGSRNYFGALVILWSKIKGSAGQSLVLNQVPLNFEAIIRSLDRQFHINKALFMKSLDRDIAKIDKKDFDIKKIVTDIMRDFSYEFESLKNLLATLIKKKEYKEQTIDDSIICNAPLEVVASLPLFDGSIFRYKKWRQKAHTTMELYKKGSQNYYEALFILRCKIRGSAEQVLYLEQVPLNFEAIIEHLDKHNELSKANYQREQEMRKFKRELAKLRRNERSRLNKREEHFLL